MHLESVYTHYLLYRHTPDGRNLYVHFPYFCVCEIATVEC
jgi:hypothetical protein